jgi:glycosyltransferase involved in cell wall biosynthesis
MSEKHQLPHRILMTADPVGGVWTYALELCRGLGALGIEVMLATMGGRLRANQHAELEALENVRVEESDFRLEWMDDPWRDVAAAAEWLLELESTFLPDVVHLNGYVHGALPWRAPTMMVAHSCVLSWWRAVKDEEAPACWRRYADAVRAGLEAAGLVAAPSAAMLDCIRRHYGAPRASRVIYNGRDPRVFSIADKAPFVLGVGRLWDEAKNAATLAKVAVDLPWPVRLAGDCVAPDGRRVQFANVLGLGSCAAPVLRELYGRAAIFALPARYEPFGLAALEAALSGCALVLGDIPSLREIWQDAAEFVAPDDAVQLRRVLQELIEDPVRRARCASRALRRAREFTTVRMIAGYVSAYAALTAPALAPA